MDLLDIYVKIILVVYVLYEVRCDFQSLLHKIYNPVSRIVFLSDDSS